MMTAWFLGSKDKIGDIRKLFSDYKPKFIDIENKESVDLFVSRVEKNEIPDGDVIVATIWVPRSLIRCITASSARLVYVEDGFIRGPGYRGRSNPPVSWLVDELAPHYDPTKPSRLENLIATYDFAADTELMARADNLRAALMAPGAGSYSHPIWRRDPAAVIGPKVGRRVVVLGHHPDMRATSMANTLGISNADLVLLAAREHPDAEIVYKPHPLLLKIKGDVLREVADALPSVRILRKEMPLAQVLPSADQVVTVASLGGFEAALRGLPVTVLGAPFYAGWGITDDRAAPDRRTRKLSPTEILAAAFLLYPVNLEPTTGKILKAEDVLDLIIKNAPFEPNIATAEQIREATLGVLGASAPVEVLRHLIPSSGLRQLSQSPDTLPAELETLRKEQLAVCPDGSVMSVIVDYRMPPRLERLVAAVNLPTVRVDRALAGFGHLDLGIDAWCRVEQAPHYDATQPSDLETLLQTHDFETSPDEIEAASRLRNQLMQQLPEAPPCLGVAIRRVMVVFEDTSIRETDLANPSRLSMEQVLRTAQADHPYAEISLYADAGHASQALKLLKKEGFQNVIFLSAGTRQLSPLVGVDHVVTLASDLGFEAVLCGLSVTVLGAPFYAGWGITDDRAAPDRRKRKLSPTEVLAAAWFLYPTFVDAKDRRVLKAADAAELVLAAAARREVDRHGILLIAPNPDVFNLQFAFPGLDIVNLNCGLPTFKTDLARAVESYPGYSVVLYHHVLGSVRRLVRGLQRRTLILGDGFLNRSTGPAVSWQPQILWLDKMAAHYDASRPTELEGLLANYDFSADPDLLVRASAAMTRLRDILSAGISSSGAALPLALRGRTPGERVVLVLGQSENQPQFTVSNPKKYTNADLLWMTALEHPGAKIFFKPHPSVRDKGLPAGILPEQVFALTTDIPLSRVLDAVDHVVTVASSGGFEALMKGLPVTVLGTPFYAGWGITDDRIAFERRTRRLSLTEIFAAIFILYAVHVDPLKRRSARPEETLDRLESLIGMGTAQQPAENALSAGAKEVLAQQYMFMPAASGKATGVAFAFSCGECGLST